MKALLAGEKTVTRRAWTDAYARRFKPGMLVGAYNRQPRYGGVKQATIMITSAPFRQSTALLTEGDYVAEGLAYYDEHPELLPKKFGGSARGFFEDWKASAEDMWVVPFTLVSVVPPVVIFKEILRPLGPVLANRVLTWEDGINFQEVSE